MGLKKRLTILLILAVLLAPGISSAGERSKYLDAAFRFLEAGNPFLVRYSALAGTEIESVCELGCPYFWGGRHVSSLLRPESPSSSSEYYQKDQKYLYGLDCVGFTRWINQKTGYEEHPPISALLNRSLYRECIIRGAAYAAGEELAALLRIGDLLAIQHLSGGFHIAMYCGTLSYYGYTAETVPPELAPYLEYPLLIHCTGSSDYHERYREFLEKQGMADIRPPFGGVIVSILDVPPSAAPSATPDAIGLSTPCFDLEGYHLQITDLSQEKQYRWIRWRQRPEKE